MEGRCTSGLKDLPEDEAIIEEKQVCDEKGEG
jgi:hypothetical protein